MFSSRENCCRIPPADNTVEAWEYWAESHRRGQLVRGGVTELLLMLRIQKKFPRMIHSFLCSRCSNDFSEIRKQLKPGPVLILCLEKHQNVDPASRLYRMFWDVSLYADIWCKLSSNNDKKKTDRKMVSHKTIFLSVFFTGLSCLPFTGLCFREDEISSNG